MTEFAPDRVEACVKALSEVVMRQIYAVCRADGELLFIPDSDWPEMVERAMQDPAKRPEFDEQVLTVLRADAAWQAEQERLDWWCPDCAKPVPDGEAHFDEYHGLRHAGCGAKIDLREDNSAITPTPEERACKQGDWW